MHWHNCYYNSLIKDFWLIYDKRNKWKSSEQINITICSDVINNISWVSNSRLFKFFLQTRLIKKKKTFQSVEHNKKNSNLSAHQVYIIFFLNKFNNLCNLCHDFANWMLFPVTSFHSTEIPLLMSHKRIIILYICDVCQDEFFWLKSHYEYEKPV